MRPPRINEGSSFGPDVLKVLSDAFDEAWQAIVGNFSPTEYDQARDTLAEALMASAREDSDDVERLREAGIRAMQMAYLTVWGTTARRSRHKDWVTESYTALKTIFIVK